MSWRRKELSGLADSILWLPKEEAARIYAGSFSKTSKSRYGLDESVWEIVDRWDVGDTNEEEISAKLAGLFGAQELFVVYDAADVFQVSPSVFAGRWRGMFLPSRDDVVIMPPSEDWCLFYSHEDEFEFGRRRRPNKAPEPTPRPVMIPAEPGITPGRVVAHL